MSDKILKLLRREAGGNKHYYNQLKQGYDKMSIDEKATYIEHLKKAHAVEQKFKQILFVQNNDKVIPTH